MTTEISLDQQIACLKREIALRKNVYPKWVQSRGMKQEDADREIAAMTAALHTVMEHQRWSAPRPELAGTKPLVLYFPDEAARDEFMDAVKEAKPGMAEYVVP